MTIKVDSAKVLTLFKEANALLKLPELVDLTIDREGVTIAYYIEGEGASLRRTDAEAIVGKAGKESISAGVPVKMLQSLLNRRGEVELELKNGELTISGSRYRAAVPVQSAQNQVKAQDTKGVDSQPLQKLIDKIGGGLDLRHTIDGTPVVVDSRWTKTHVSAVSADDYHAVLVRGPHGLKNVKEGSLSLPASDLYRLVKAGGALEVAENSLAAVSKNSYLRFQRVASGQLITIDMVERLLSKKAEWSCTFSTAEFMNAYNSAAAVLPSTGAPSLAIKIDGTKMTLIGNSNFGRARATINIGGPKGKAPTELLVNHLTIPSVFGLLGDKGMLSVIGNGMLVQNLVPDNWTMYGFASLSST